MQRPPHHALQRPARGPGPVSSDVTHEPLVRPQLRAPLQSGDGIPQGPAQSSYAGHAGVERHCGGRGAHVLVRGLVPEHAGEEEAAQPGVLLQLRLRQVLPCGYRCGRCVVVLEWHL